MHTDLKPENILLVSNDYTKEPCPPGTSAMRVPVSSKIKLIDFGNATFHNQYHCRCAARALLVLHEPLVEMLDFSFRSPPKTLYLANKK